MNDNVEINRAFMGKVSDLRDLVEWIDSNGWHLMGSDIWKRLATSVYDLYATMPDERIVDRRATRSTH